MLGKPRYESDELQLLRSLHARMDLPEKEVNYYWNIQKGYEGEQRFDGWLMNLPDDWIVLHDLLFESNNTLFQIDSLLLSPGTIYLFEVKNYEGDYYLENNRWYSKTGNEIKNPLLQLNRSESLFRRLLQDLGYNPNFGSPSIEAYVIFINPDFYLYQAPLDLPVIFSTQLKRFFNKLNFKPQSKVKNPNSKLADQLLSVHLKESPYSRLPGYTYAQLKKGITCGRCHSFVDKITNKTVICTKCGVEENLVEAVLRSVKEYKLLFPDRKVTTNSVYEWCNRVKPKKRFRKILSFNHILVGHGKSSYFIEKGVNSD